MYSEFLVIIIGTALIVGLGEIIIRNAIELATHFKIDGSLIGLTILSIGTSIPELMTHIIGSINIVMQPESIHTISGLMVGTNIGSDVFQQNFILPLIGLIGTVVVVRSKLVSEVGALIAAAVLVLLFSLGGLISRLEGVILVIAYLAYLALIAKKNHLTESLAHNNQKQNTKLFLSLSLILLCFVIMGVIAEQVLQASISLVNLLPISASFFGVMILGIASALPELTTALISIVKGQKELSAGILIGSNITNPLLGIGIGASISTYTIPYVITVYDLPIKIFTAILIYIFLFRHEDLNKKEAYALIVLYVLYVFGRNWLFPEDITSGNIS